jgi:hypothetical protein
VSFYGPAPSLDAVGHFKAAQKAWAQTLALFNRTLRG